MTKKSLENFVGKGINDSNQHFLFSPQYFLPFRKQKLFVEFDSLFTKRQISRLLQIESIKILQMTKYMWLKH